MNDSTTYGICVLSLFFKIKPLLYQNLPKNYQLFKAIKDPKIILKITLMLLFDHFMSKRYQKVPSYINLRVYYGQLGFVTPSDHCALLKQKRNDYFC